MKNNTTEPRLAIKMNVLTGGQCPYCNGETNANIGVEIVDDATNAPVCRDCAIEYAVDLAYLINLAEGARLLATSEQRFGVKTEPLYLPTGLDWQRFGFDESANLPKTGGAAR